MLCNAFSKKSKLKSSQYSQTFNHVKYKFYTTHFTFLVSIPKNDYGIGIIIAKKKVKLSSKRNLCKRIVREFYRTHKNKKLFEGYNVIVIANHRASKATRAQLWYSLNSFYLAFEKA